MIIMNRIALLSLWLRIRRQASGRISQSEPLLYHHDERPLAFSTFPLVPHGERDLGGCGGL